MMGGLADKDSSWYKQCIAVKSANIPSKDIPSEQLAQTLSRCNATNLYYDTKTNINHSNLDWEKVRNCAFAEKDDAVLMMLYANGFGVTRNINLAIYFACKVGGAPAEADSRVSHLENLKDDKENNVFDLCDDITSGFMGGFCASIKEREDEQIRTKRLVEFGEKLTNSQKTLFNQLQVAAKNFAELRGNNETDQMGTARSELVIEARGAELDSFETNLYKFESGNIPHYTSEQFGKLDKSLNHIYQEIMHAKVGDDLRLGFTTITTEDVKNTQRAWIKYRDAWVSFGRARYTSFDPISLKGLFTEQRIDQLNELLVMTKD